MRTAYLTAFVALAAAAAMAQPGDPPARVGRLNYLNGPVSFRPGSVDDWAAATLNYPLTTGDHLWTDAGAQAEIHIGSTAVRMAPQTAISFLNLDDQMAQISLTGGDLDVHIRYLGENESVEVDTPNAAISLLRSGDYRFHANGDNAVTVVNVRGGEAEVTAGGSAFPARSGQSARLDGMDTPTQDLAAVPPPDEFDRWCEMRERREMSSASARYVPREMVGYEDLDEAGVWTEVPPYGMVWRPRVVVAGWAPYRFGHWAWVEPWGWTWIDDAPWGFAPFHYGRWAFAAGAWYWVPGRMVVGGPVRVRPVYAPALVAFVGGPNFGVAVGVGGGGVAAWFPLGPGEVYRPAYHVSPAYVTNINIVHVSNVTVINQVNVTNVRYVNREVVGAVSVVPRETFVSARPVGVAAVRVTPAAVMRAEVVGAAPAIVPRRESVMATTVASVRTPPARIATREVVVRHTPPPAPVAFGAQQRALEANGGRPLAPEQINSIRAAAPPRAPSVRNAGPEAPRPQAAPRPMDAPRQMEAPRPQSGPRPMEAPRPQQAPVNRPQFNDRPTMNARPQMSDRPPSPRPNPAHEDRPPANEQRGRPAANEARPNETRPNNERPNDQQRKNDRPNSNRNSRKSENTEKKG